MWTNRGPGGQDDQAWHARSRHVERFRVLGAQASGVLRRHATRWSDLGFSAELHWPIRSARRVLRVVVAAGAEQDPGQLVLLGEELI